MEGSLRSGMYVRVPKYYRYLVATTAVAVDVHLCAVRSCPKEYGSYVQPPPNKKHVRNTSKRNRSNNTRSSKV